MLQFYLLSILPGILEPYAFSKLNFPPNLRVHSHYSAMYYTLSAFHLGVGGMGVGGGGERAFAPWNVGS